MRVGIISYGAGNVRSVQNALERLGCEVLISADPSLLEGTDKVIFPGVGEAASAMRFIDREGVADWMRTTAKSFLGICLGMQVMYESSTERDTTCLGMLDGTVQRFSGVKVPHMGWNRVSWSVPTPLFAGIANGSHFYFAHSYYASVSEETLATTVYERQISVAVNQGSNWGVQFHPEKSGSVGLRLLQNFIERC
jgi:glutamine amidotransferase